jgi:hypothetical protein
MLYATHAIFETDSEIVDLNWLYMRTQDAPKVKPVRLRVHAEHVFKQFDEIEATGLEMLEAHKAFDADPHAHGPLSLKPNVDACDAYGGCPYRDKCNLSPKEIIESKAAKVRRLTEESSMSGAVDLLAKLRAKRPSGPVPSPIEERNVASMEPPSTACEVTEAKALPEPLPINPPESALPPPPVEASGDAEDTEKPKRGAGRTKTAKSAPKDRSAADGPSASAAARTPIGTLYLDCYPLAENVVHAETLFRTAQERIERDHGVLDYRLIDFKGAGIFASTLGAIVDATTPGTNVVLDTRTPEGALAKSALVFRSSRVVQGLR